MILADELAAIEEKLEQQASTKERAFYQRLIGDPLPYPGDDQLNDIEQVCLSAFCTSAPDKADLVSRFRRSKPIKGIYYANNLVELAAFAIYDRKVEADHLKSFCSTSSARDCFILNRLFPGVYASQPATIRAVDSIAAWLCDDSFPVDWQSVFLEAIQNANDLLDLYVIRQGYMHLWRCHPSMEQRRDLQYLSSQLERVTSYITARSNRRFNVIASAVIFAGLVVVARFAVRRWDVAEPIFWVMTAIGAVAALLVPLFSGEQLDKIHLLKRMRDNRARAAIHKVGLDEEEIQKVVAKYTGTDTQATTRKLTTSNAYDVDRYNGDVTK